MKATATAQQKPESVPEHVVPTTIQRAPCAKYPTPPLSPDSYTGADYEDIVDSDGSLPGAVFHTKWEHPDEDSYSSLCPKDKKYSCRRPPSVREEDRFLQYFSETPNTVPFWAMLDIRADLEQEYKILTQARRIADMRRKAKKGQHCFVNRDVNRRQELEQIIRAWHTKVRSEKDKGLIPRKLSALSQEDQNFYHEQKAHYQAITDAYTNWYNRCREISQENDSTYFYCDPWEVDFEVTTGALESPLDGFLNKT